MPELSRFLGIVIYMYLKDHNPPHFNAKYGKHWAQIEISTMQVMAGQLPRPQLALVVAWGLLNQYALSKAWEAAVKDRSPGKISPLAIGKRSKKKKGGKK
jgi:hypothetical protein